jgi:hypothetical protein
LRRDFFLFYIPNMSKGEIPSKELAQVVIAEFIIEPGQPLESLSLGSQAEDYQNKVLIYRLALVLIILLAKEKEHPEFLKVRTELESLTFENFRDGISLLEHVRTAMSNLSDFLFGEQRRELSWARMWLQDIGIIELNPATLTLFALDWMNTFKMMHEFFDKCTPI